MLHFRFVMRDIVKIREAGIQIIMDACLIEKQNLYQDVS